MTQPPVRLQASFHEKIWGVKDLEPWFRPTATRTGEVWFSLPGPAPLPILVKFIFTSEQLSIQVHPDDAYALTHEGAPSGKTEMWYVLRAEPGARLAAGFREPLSRERARAAAISGEIEHLLQWFPVSAGQVFVVPAGTVHTLGAGITVCEIQQNNPITYRLYDYGRPRELQLDKALDVARLTPYPGPSAPTGSVLATCDRFTLERVDVIGEYVEPADVRFHLLVFIKGSGHIAGAPFTAGETWYVPSNAGAISIRTDRLAVLLRARPAS